MFQFVWSHCACVRHMNLDFTTISHSTHFYTKDPETWSFLFHGLRIEIELELWVGAKRDGICREGQTVAQPRESIKPEWLPAAWREGGLIFILNQKWWNSVSCSSGAWNVSSLQGCRARLTQWTKVIIGCFRTWYSKFAFWLRASIQTAKKLWLESWLCQHPCAFEQVIYCSGPLFSSFSNAADESLDTVSRKVKWSSCWR